MIARLSLTLALVACVCACGDPGRDNGTPDIQTEPGTRIVTLAPHLAELVFAVGAGAQLVGVSAYTDYPEAAARLPVIGDAFVVDQEQLSLLKPELLLAWESGTPAHAIDELRSHGYRVEAIRTRTLADIATALQRIGALTGRDADALAVATGFEDGLDELSARYAGANTISVFYQVSARPLYTINASHYVSEIIDRCGGANIFADLNELAPIVAVEAVIERNPEVMLASSDAGEDAFAVWQRWPVLAANRHGNQFWIPANEVGRPTPRLLAAGQAICKALQDGRENRSRDESR